MYARNGVLREYAAGSKCIERIKRTRTKTKGIMAKKIKREKAKGSGRKKLYNEETGLVTFRAPKSKIKEIKDHVKGMLRNWIR